MRIYFRNVWNKTKICLKTVCTEIAKLALLVNPTNRSDGFLVPKHALAVYKDLIFKTKTARQAGYIYFEV